METVTRGGELPGVAGEFFLLVSDGIECGRFQFSPSMLIHRLSFSFRKRRRRVISRPQSPSLRTPHAVGFANLDGSEAFVGPAPQVRPSPIHIAGPSASRHFQSSAS